MVCRVQGAQQDYANGRWKRGGQCGGAMELGDVKSQGEDLEQARCRVRSSAEVYLCVWRTEVWREA